MTLIPRDYRTTGAAVGGDITKMIEQSPDAFDCLLFRARNAEVETVAEPAEDVVGSIEHTERAVNYDDPVEVRAVKIPDQSPVSAAVDGEQPTGEYDQPVVLILNVPDVPQQSVIQYSEFMDSDVPRRVYFYVLRSDQIAEGPGAGLMRHYCMPFPQFSDLADDRP